MAKFKVVIGTHLEDGKSYGKDQIVKSDKDLSTLFPGKFTKLEYAPPEPAPEAEEAEPAPAPVKHTTMPAAAKPAAAKGRPAKG